MRPTEPAASLEEVTAPSPSLGVVTAPSLILGVLTAPSASALVLTAFLAILGDVTAPLARSLLAIRLPATPGALAAIDREPRDGGRRRRAGDGCGDRTGRGVLVLLSFISSESSLGGPDLTVRTSGCWPRSSATDTQKSRQPEGRGVRRQPPFSGPGNSRQK